MPRCFVPWDDASDNIDLFPEGFLWERGCKIERADKHQLVTPKGRIFEIKTWGSLPYLSKNDVNLILDDLPESTIPGRNGHSAGNPKAARVSKTVTQRQLRSQLNHLQGEYSKAQISNIQAKYRKLPDLYYDDEHKVVTPDKFATEFLETSQGLPRSRAQCLEPAADAHLRATILWEL